MDQLLEQLETEMLEESGGFTDLLQRNPFFRRDVLKRDQLGSKLPVTISPQEKTTILKTWRRSLLTGALTWDPGNLADGAGETSSAISVPDAELGDFALCSAPYDLQGVLATCYVDSADSVKIRLQNETTGAVDLASGVWNVLVIKKNG